MVRVEAAVDHGRMELYVFLASLVVLPLAGFMAAARQADQAVGARQVELSLLSAVLAVLTVLCTGLAWYLWRFSVEFTW